MATPPPPRIEGMIRLADGRRLGFAEYGVATGRPVLWFHGTPGARRQIPIEARQAADERGVRIIVVERPGVGDSTPHLHRSLRHTAGDIDQFATTLGLDRFGLIGLSGGGPYVLACAHELPDRVVSAAVLGGVAPSTGVDAAEGGLVRLAARTHPVLRRTTGITGPALRTTVRVLKPVGPQAIALYAALSPPGDRAFFSHPGVREMFIGDLTRGAKRSFHAVVYDLVLFGQEWGFSPRDIRVPVHLWHGDADNIVPLAHGQHLATMIPGAELRVRDGESHLGNLMALDEVLDALLGDWPED